METNSQSFWKKCSICKKPIAYSAKYYLCSVSTCKHPRKGFTFCSVDCWDAHLGYVNHRESWAEENKAPSQIDVAKATGAADVERPPVRKVVFSRPEESPTATASVSSAPALAADSVKTDTLVVVSKVKDLIRKESDFNTSQCCIDALTKVVVQECLKAIEHARDDGRKTVMGRDVMK